VRRSKFTRAYYLGGGAAVGSEQRLTAKEGISRVSQTGGGQGGNQMGTAKLWGTLIIQPKRSLTPQDGQGVHEEGEGLMPKSGKRKKGGKSLKSKTLGKGVFQSLWLGCLRRWGGRNLLRRAAIKGALAGGGSKGEKNLKLEALWRGF